MAEAASGPTIPGAPATTRAWLAWSLGLLWAGLHLGGLWLAGAPLGGPQVLLWGSVPAAQQVEQGALVPARLVAGEPWRAITGAGVVAQGLLGLLLALWVLWGTVRPLEPWLGRARLLLVLLLATLAGAAVRTWVDPAARTPQAAGWDLVLGALGARIPLGLALGGRAGRQVASGALAWVALSALLAYALPGTPLSQLAGEGAGLAGGALAVLLLGPRRCLQPPGRVARRLGTLAAALVVASAALQAHAALGGAEREQDVRAWLQRLERAERTARALRDGRARATEEDAQGLRALLEALRRDAPQLPGEAGETLQAYLDLLDAVPGEDLRDPSLGLGRLQRGYGAWAPHESRLRQRHGVLTRAVPPWR